MLIINIKSLCGVRTESKFLRGKEMAELPSVENAYLEVEGDRIMGFGEMDALKPEKLSLQTCIDATGQFVLPAWCDPHTHLVFAGSRESEFVDKIKGLSYAEIAKKGGGILNSAALLRNTSEDELFDQAWKRLVEVRAMGTSAIEIKSGYGLCVESELKMLRVIKRLKEQSDMDIKATFLGAHAFPPEYQNDHKGYIELICNKMLPKVAEERLAEYVDVFFEKGFFDADETQRVIDAANKFGLKGKLHANQLTNSGGVQFGVANDLLSVDHLESIGEEEIEVLKGSQTIPTLLPSAAFFLRMPYPPARKMIDEGLGVALATDYNPGSSPSGNIPLLMSLSCVQMKMTPEEAVNAVTMNAACAMELEHELGSITVGKKANLVFTKPMNSLAYLPYAFGDNLIDKVMVAGKF
ncbi:imidazolonepropionase [Echinicola sp. CAU 1574]|uniref:Imidazolonepropionase n=1 Tax=Echinicola arenosa TaxID=2774144 RepID=A0ABR9APM6_9BACT|nr:imidazolonepropionase [Echinicola arenosa]MBD8490307.1 imidazolonepropionase [Echinicola arenosa]